MNDVLKVDIASEADIFIMEYKLKKFMQKYHLDLPSVLLVARELATNILKYGYFNIGNIRGWILFPDSVKKLKEIPGVVGRMPVRVKVFEESVSLLYSTLLVCTDGIKRQFIPTPEMAWIRTLNPRDVAEKIMEDFSINEDDATVMIARGGIGPWKTCSAL